jgi:lipopolysaccharide biosynthesis regulator YciM
MKIKLLMVALSGLISVTAFAQKGELNTAQSEYNEYEVASGSAAKIPALAVKAKTNLSNAKAAIDKASANAKTSALPLTFALKAAIYASVAVDDSVQTTSAVAYNTAAEALKQAKTLDTKNENSKLTDHANIQLAQYLLNKGMTEFQNKKYNDAYKSFDNARLLIPNDTTTIINTAIAAINAKNYTAGIANYNALLKTNYSAKNKIYNDLPGLYLANKDTTGALKSIDEALVKYPTNTDLRRLEIEIALQTGKLGDLTAKIQSAIANDPKNKVLQYYAGLTYSQIGDAANANSAKAKDDATKKSMYQTALDNYTKAVDYYKKAIEIDPEYFEANLNLGYVLIRPAVDGYNIARNLPANKEKEYNAAIAKANAQFDLAKPYLQKAVDIKPTSLDALTNLRNYYRGKSDPAHAAENKAKADDLKKQIDALTAK